MSLAVNSLSLIVSTMIQAAGRPDVTAKCHLLELPLYMLAVVVFTRSYGIVGCALAGLFRLLVDAVLLIWFSRRIKAPLPRRWVYGLALTGTAAMLVFSSSMSAALRAVAVCGTVATGCVFLRRESSGTQLSCRSTAE
jgi:O-antigen/teichoic acid export membrane protein